MGAPGNYDTATNIHGAADSTPHTHTHTHTHHHHHRHVTIPPRAATTTKETKINRFSNELGALIL